MALEQLRAEIAMLVQQMEHEPEDIHELHAQIRSKLNEIKAMGMPLPDDLVALEKRLDGEERSLSRGREAPATEETQRSTRRPGRRQPAKRAKPPAAKKAKPPAAKKAKPPAAKAARKARGSAAKKAKRPAAKAARKARGSAAKKSKRAGRRRR